MLFLGQKVLYFNILLLNWHSSYCRMKHACIHNVHYSMCSLRPPYLEGKPAGPNPFSPALPNFQGWPQLQVFHNSPKMSQESPKQTLWATVIFISGPGFIVCPSLIDVHDSVALGFHCGGFVSASTSMPAPCCFR